jgi:hypothetical protein
MTKSQDKPFCYAPWTNIQYSGVYEGGGASPCCEWHGKRFTGNVNEYLDSDYLTKIKKSMIDHNMEEIKINCDACIHVESKGLLSQRHFIESKSQKYNQYDKVWRIDYRPDNLCNFKCRMCSPYSSNLIEEEYVKIGRLENFIEKRNTDDVVDFDFSSLKEFAILGGEPTFNKKLYKILDYLIENKYNEQIMISYTTNCSSIPLGWSSRIKKFKDLHVNISLDAIGKTLEYVRTNANWKILEKNVAKTLELTNSYSFRPVLTAYNFVTVEEWVEYFFQFPEERVDISPVYGEIPLKITAIPDHIREKKIKYLESLKHPIADSIINIAKTYKFDSNYLKKFKYKTETDDKNRNTSVFDLSNEFREIWNY